MCLNELYCTGWTIAVYTKDIGLYCGRLDYKTGMHVSLNKATRFHYSYNRMLSVIDKLSALDQSHQYKMIAWWL